MSGIVCQCRAAFGRYARAGVALVMLVTAAAQSSDAGQGTDSSKGDIERIAREFAVEASRVRPSPVPGLYEIAVGTNFIYATADRRFLISGDIIEASSGNNVSEARRLQLRAEIVSRVGRTVEPVVFSSPAKRHSITAFVDLDCPLCRKMHGDIQSLLSRGIEVRYVFYPSGDADSDVWKKTRAVWCAKDRQAALSAALQGRPPAQSADCDGAATLEAHRQFGKALGVQGTPTIVDAEGRLIMGYRSPEILEASLGSKAVR
jgi:thiol:disulfide interchange protein DsbC